MPDPAAVNSMFARIARRYDVANHLLSAGIDIRWRRKLVEAVRRQGSRAILDLATGSGDVAFALSRGLPGDVWIVGMDFCQPMLDEAEIKKQANNFGNMGDLQKALGEMRRVLRPGGRMFVLEFSQPARWFRPLYYFYIRRILPGLAALVTGDRSAYVYLNETIEQFPNREALSEKIRSAGFHEVRSTPLTFGIVALHEAVA